MSTKRIRVAVCEDNSRLAMAIEEKLGLFRDEVEFAFLAVNGKELLRRLPNEAEVDVVLMDIEMPVMDGITCTGRMHEEHPEVKVIMLTVFEEEERIFRAIQAGASGYLLKDEPADKILEGILQVMEGGAPMTPSIALKALRLLREPPRLEDLEQQPDFALSKRETEVLEQLCKGHSYQQIAEALFIAPATVRKHIENIYRKLQVCNKMQAAEKARRYKLL